MLIAKLYGLFAALIIVIGADAWIMDIETEHALKATGLSEFVNKQMLEYKRPNPNYCNKNTAKCNNQKINYLFNKD